jgi:hypothetical protein
MISNNSPNQINNNSNNPIYLIPCTIAISKSLPRYNVPITFYEENNTNTVDTKLEEAKENFIISLNTSISNYLESDHIEYKENEFLKAKDKQRKLNEILHTSIPNLQKNNSAKLRKKKDIEKYLGTNNPKKEDNYKEGGYKSLKDDKKDVENKGI